MQLLLTLPKYLVFVAALFFSLLFAWQDLYVFKDQESLNNTVTKLSITSAPQTMWESIAENFSLHHHPVFNGTEFFNNTIAHISIALTPLTIWESIAENFSLDHQTHKKQVQTEIRKLLANQSRLYQILEAASPYIHFIFETTKSYNMPAELALIPFIESEFNPNDRSHKGATGLWQLMPQTARELGVKVKGGYDGRRNLISSTNAALTYFNDLININSFKRDWYLAIASYNAGPGRVLSATRKGRTQTFWNLRLPKETQLYVPRLLAVAAIIKEPEKYGVQLPLIHNKPYFTEMTLKKPVTLDKMAKLNGVNLKILRQLNPDVKNVTVSQKNGEHKVLIPLKISTTKSN